MESKRGDVEEFVAEDVLTALIEYCDSPAFISKVEEFRTENCTLFSRFNEEKQPDENQPLELYEIFLEYQALIEKLLSQYSKTSGISEKMLFANCRDVADGKFVPLFEEHPNKWFVDTMLDWSDYAAFCESMCNHARTQICRK